MTSSIRCLPVIAFAMGVVSGVIAARLWPPGEGVSRREPARVEVASENPLLHTSDRPSVPSVANPGLHSPSADDAGAGLADRAAAHADCGEREGISEDTGQDGTYWNEAGELDSALEEERYASADAAYERETMRRHQEEILAKEEERSLYELPSDGYVLGDEEQDTRERKLVNDSVSGVSVEDEPLQQQTLANETQINELYGDRAESREEGED